MPPQLRDLQLPEQLADHLDLVRQQLAQVLVGLLRLAVRAAWAIIDAIPNPSTPATCITFAACPSMLHSDAMQF